MSAHNATLSSDFTSTTDRVRRAQPFDDRPTVDETRTAVPTTTTETTASAAPAEQAFLLDDDDADIVEAGAESDALRRIVVKHPVLAVIGAVSTGFVVGRLLR